MSQTMISDSTEWKARGRPGSAAYWRSRLAGLGGKTSVPPDLHSSAAAKGETRPERLRLPDELARRLDQITGNQPAALHVALAAAVVALLHRHTGADDIVIGQPTLSTTAECPNTMLVLRSSVGSETTFRDLLFDVRTAVREAIEHQDFPVVLLAEELGRRVGEGENPYFDVAVELDGLHDRALARTAPVGLLVSAARDAEGLAVSVTYDASRYTAMTIARFVRHLVLLLDQAVADPDRCVDDLDLYTHDDDALVKASNATDAPFDSDGTIHGLLARQAARTPDAVALVAGGHTLTYAELDARSTQLARALRDRVGPDDVVGVLADRSVEMIVAIFAVLKAGGAYLPLDPSYPEARLSYLVADSGAQLLLAQSRYAATVGGDIEIVDLDEESSYAASAEPLAPTSTSRNLAYVIYTSGSTGNPKGVMIEHRSVINRLTWMQRAYPLASDDVILQKTSISFDVSVWELFWCSFVGAQLVLLQPGGEKDPAAIIDAIEARRVTTMHFVPSMLTMFLAHADRFGASARLSSLRRVFTSGEALGRHHVARFAETVGGADLVNLYGPTEATVDVTYHPCDELRELARVPIGRPIDNTRLYVLDGRLRPAPVGVAAELYIAGAGVARGYLNRPELTAEHFVDGGPVGEERLYRTGDQARWLSDGVLDYLGRVDLQVKVRGFRVELGEIEERLRSHPHVDAAAVAAFDDGWQTALRGYVVPRAELSEQELKAYLRETLPEYMVPGQIVPIDALPVTSNGKLDRGSLARSGVACGQAPVKVAPRNDLEKALALIWRDVLGVAEIGVFDNFFALGGNSIHFVSVLAKARAAGLNFTFQQLFTLQTVAALAANMDGGGLADAGGGATRPFELVSAVDRAKLPEGVEDAYPLSLLQAGLIFQTEITGASGQYHDVLGYLIRGAFDAGAFESAVRIMIRRHPVLRTTYHLTGFSEFIQVVHREVPPPYTVVDLRHLSSEEQEVFNHEWVAREKARPFRWEEGGLVSLHVQTLSDDLFRYTVSQHNSALDGWSISLLHTQLFELYYRIRDGREPEGHQLDNHLRNFIALERNAISATESRRFWMDVLDDSECTTVPRRPDAQESDTFEVILHDVPLPAGLTERIDAVADALGIPVKDVLLAAHVKVLSVVAGAREVMTGYEHSGRPELPGAERALGLFLNTLPFRIELVDGSWEDLIRQIYRAEADLLPHRRYPMARMKQDLATQRTLFETTFNFTHFYLLKKLRELPQFSLLDMRVDSETEFAFRTEVSRHFFDDDVRLCLHYHSQLFDSEQIARIGGYFVRALELMTTQPQARHNGQSLCSEAELRRLAEFGKRGIEALDAPHPSLSGEGRSITVQVLDEHLQPAPIGSTGDIAFADISTPGLRRSGDRGRWLPDGQLEVVTTDRARSPELDAPTPLDAQRPEVFAADDSMVGEIAYAWAQVLDLAVEQIGASDSFFELGGNSLSALRVVLELDGLVTLTDLTRHPRLDQLAKLVSQRERGDEELVQLLSSTEIGTRCALVCVPYPAGHPINFGPLAEALEERTSDLAVYGIEQPGHDPQRPGTFVGVVETARRIVDEMAEKIAAPVMLWGHCGGASVTLEVARQLEEQGFDLRHVFIGSKLLPTAEDMRESLEMLERWSDDDIIRYMVDETGYDLDGLNQHHSDFFAEVFRHDVLNGYRYFLDASARREWRIAAPFTFVVAADDAGLTQHPGEYQRWGVLAEDVRLHVVASGGHYFVRTNPAEIAELIERAWDAASAAQEA